jgi:hypothetical protein
MVGIEKEIEKGYSWDEGNIETKPDYLWEEVEYDTVTFVIQLWSIFDYLIKFTNIRYMIRKKKAVLWTI